MPLWDIYGDYTNMLEEFGPQVTFRSVYSLNQSASGKLTGAGTFSFVGTSDGIDYEITNGVLKIGGTVTGAGAALAMRITTTGSGSRRKLPGNPSDDPRV